MHYDLVACRVLRAEGVAEEVSAAADGTEGGFEVFFLEVLEEPGGGRAGTIVKGKTPCVLIRAGNDIGTAGAATTSPPAAGGVSRRLRVRCAASLHCGRYIGNLMSL